jgi:cell wall-associated NlpC family hydrolase
MAAKWVRSSTHRVTGVYRPPISGITAFVVKAHFKAVQPLKSRIGVWCHFWDNRCDMKTRHLIGWMIITGSVLLSCMNNAGTNEKERDTVFIFTTDTLKAKSGDSLKKDSATLIIDTLKTDSVMVPNSQVHTKNVHPQQVVDFAKTLIGIPYRYASTDPKTGFDCSGFITYVFNHFKIIVPRSSIDFTNVGKEVGWQDAKPGDLVLFTGTDSTEKFVGHMGLIVSNNNQQVEFIHSTSGKKYGVTITPLSNYYMSRYMKTIRIFPEND